VRVSDLFLALLGEMFVGTWMQKVCGGWQVDADRSIRFRFT
jgi:hypothetical protein